MTTTLIRDVRVFDGRSVVGADTVRVTDGLVTAVGDGLRPGPDDDVVDGAGATLLPGLIDAHTHVFPGSLEQAADPPAGRTHRRRDHAIMPMPVENGLDTGGRSAEAPTVDHRLLAFAAAAAVVIVIPGPSVVFTVGRALAAGRSAALATVVGNAVGVLLQVVAVAVGLGQLVAQSAAAFTVLKLVGAAYLVYLGVAAFRHRHDVVRAMQRSAGDPRYVGPVRSVLDGLVVGVLNPKSVVFFVAFLPQFVDARGPVVTQILLLGAVFVVIALVLDSAWSLAAGSARAWFASSPRRLAAVGGAGGLAMIGLGVGVAATGSSQ